MKKLSLRKGFTLIELLVVVAIIGVLASVVLASLNSARSKGGDAAVKSNLANIRAQAEILFDKNGKYDIDATATSVIVCTPQTANSLTADPNIWAMLNAAISAGGGISACRVDATAQTWSVGIQLKENPLTEAWCVDSSGAAKKETLDGSPTQAELNALINDAATLGRCD